MMSLLPMAEPWMGASALLVHVFENMLQRKIGVQHHTMSGMCPSEMCCSHQAPYVVAFEMTMK